MPQTWESPGVSGTPCWGRQPAHVPTTDGDFSDLKCPLPSPGLIPFTFPTHPAASSGHALGGLRVTFPQLASYRRALDTLLSS